MFSFKFVVRDHTLKLRITKDRQSRYVSLRCGKFSGSDLVGGKVLRSHENWRLSNDRIAHYYGICRRLQVEGANLTLNEILEQVKGGEDRRDFYKWCEVFISRYDNKGSADLARVVVGKLKRYSALLSFEEIDGAFIAGFERHLLTFNSINTTAKALRTVKAIYRAAIAEGWIDGAGNPFDHYRIRQQKTSKQILTLDEVRAIEAVELTRKPEQLARDVWMFQFYAQGLRIGDALRVRCADVDGDFVNIVQQKVRKTDKRVLQIYITDRLRAIIDRYNEGTGYLFPLCVTGSHDEIKTKTAYINKYIKKVAARAGVAKRITTHTARHSFAMYADDSGVGLAEISKMLGHADTATTHNYLRGLRESGHKDTLKRLFD